MRLLSVIATVIALSVAVLSAQEVFNPGDDGVSRPVAINVVKPQYTEEAKAAGIQGRVIMQGVILADGSVGDVTVTESLDSVNGLDAQATEAFKQSTFKPGMKDGKPVAVRVYMESTFTLK